jgi:SNF2 family DNA or RNA helicase
MSVGTFIMRTLREFLKGKMDAQVASQRIGERIGLNTDAVRLRPHQLRGVAAIMRHISKRQAGGVLAHEMGLGKSLQALLVAAIIFQITREQISGDQANTARILVVVPTSMVTTWAEYWAQYMRASSVEDVRVCTMDRDRKELAYLLPESQRTWHILLIASHQAVDRAVCRELQLAEWTHTKRKDKLKPSEMARVMFSHVFVRPRQDAPFSGRHEWSPEHIHSWAPGGLLCPFFFDMVIVDEAHVAKTPTTSVFASLCLLRADLKLGLTGTPLVNSVLDVAALAHLTQVCNSWHALKSEDHWLAHDLMRPPLIHTWMHVEKRHDDSGIPEIRVQRLRVGLCKRDTAAYDAALSSVADDFGSAMRQLVMLRRIACLGAGVGTAVSRKVERCVREMSAILADPAARIVFFSEWTSCLNAVASHFSSDSVSRLDGSSSTRERDQAVSNFQNGPARIFFVTHGAGGVGLNLTRGTHVIMFEPYWNFARMQQAVARVARMGCTAPVVTVVFLVTKATIEEIILNKVATSKFVQGQFHIEGVGEQTERYRLNMEELRDLLEQARLQRKRGQGQGQGQGRAQGQAQGQDQGRGHVRPIEFDVVPIRS